MVLYHIVLRTSKIPAENLLLNVVERQLLPDFENTDSRKQISCLNWTIYNGRRKVCINFKTDTDNLYIMVFRYRNSLYFKDNKFDLKLIEYRSLLAKRVYLLIYIDIFLEGRILLDETSVHKKSKLRQKWIFSF